MKKMLYLPFLVLVWFGGGAFVLAQDDIERHPSCPLCGMDRRQYAHSRMLVEYTKNEATGTCSIHCAASELSVNRQKVLVSMRVADYFTRELILAEKASWVIGGNKAGVKVKIGTHPF